MSTIVSSYHHCDAQQFQILSCVHYTIFSVVYSYEHCYWITFLLWKKNYAYASRTTCYTEAHFDTSTSIPGHYKFQAILSLISSPKPRQKAIITHMQWLTIIFQKLRIHVICLQHNDLYGLT